MAEQPQTEKSNRRLIYGRRQGHRLHKKQARLVADLLPQLSPDLAASAPPQAWFDKPFSSYVLAVSYTHLTLPTKA